jgi:hypothetical protein
VAEKAVELGRAGTNLLHEALARNALARASVLNGAFDVAEREAMQALRLTHAATVCVESEALLAETYLATGRAEDALRATERAMTLLERHGAIGHSEAMVRLLYGTALHATGDDNAARAVIALAHRRLLERADRIANAEERHSFLTRVPENARTAALALSWGVSTAPEPLLGAPLQPAQ